MTGISSSSWVSRITWACVLFTKTEFGFTDFSSSFSWVSGISWGHSLSTTDFSFGWNSSYVISDSKQYSTFRFITSFISDFFSTIFSGSMWWLLIQFFIFSSVSFFSNECLFFFYVARELRVYLHNVRSDDKNDLFSEEYVPQHQNLSPFLEFLLQGKWRKGHVVFQSLV